jgi:hypothetical protein
MGDIWIIHLIRDLYQGTLGQLIESEFMILRALGMSIGAALLAAVSAGLKAVAVGLIGPGDNDGSSGE